MNGLPTGPDPLDETVVGLQKLNEISSLFRQQPGAFRPPEESMAPLSFMGDVGSSTQEAAYEAGKGAAADATKIQLTRLLPPQTQCDLFVSYFLEHADWVHRAIHVPSFRLQYVRFWTMPVRDIDLIWLSLLLIIISVSALRMPRHTCSCLGMESSQVRKLAHRWFRASRQALQAGGFESSPSIVQIQTFVISQLYCLSTGSVEILNSDLGRAVRNAQALGLDKPSSSSIVLEREMRHRLWWEVCHADTFQSMCLGRMPLIQAYLSKVPFPVHCNNVDITEAAVKARPLTEATDLSMNIVKYKMFKLYNKLYKENGDHLQSYEFVEQINAEVEQIERELPWFYDAQHADKFPLSSPLESVPWEHHTMHTCRCLQVLRMYRPFLHPQVPQAWDKCLKAAERALDVYRALRRRNLDLFRKSAKLSGQNYQIFSVATFLSLFLLMERSDPQGKIRRDIDMVMSDLEYLDYPSEGSAAQFDGIRVLRNILELYGSTDLAGQVNRTSIVPGIYAVFGGEASSQSYLGRSRDLETTSDDQHELKAVSDTRGQAPNYSRTISAQIQASEELSRPQIEIQPVESDQVGQLDNVSRLSPFPGSLALDVSYDFWQWDQWDLLYGPLCEEDFQMNI
ncbi:Fungal specific transcription factor domain-containing protein [Cladophialophora immunda]|nr:Fungal specific transcription factor domain-containing protein [Cladophialophora immunda]